MFITRRKDRLYRAYSVWEADKNGKMISKVKLAGFLGYYSEIIKNDPEGYEKLKALVKVESNALYASEREQRTADSLQKIKDWVENPDDEEPYAGHPSLDYGNYVLLPLWKELGLPRVLDYHWSKTNAEFDAPELFYQSVVNRIISPCSHLRHYEERLNWLGAPLRNINEKNLYRMLDFAYLLKERILKTVNRNIHNMGLRDLTVVFYDCTILRSFSEWCF